MTQPTKSRILYSLISILVVFCLAWTAGGTFGTGAGGGASCTESCGDYLVCQNFEGAGYDNSETWVEAIGGNGTADEDYTTTPGRGSQCLHLIAGDDGVHTTAHIQLGTTYSNIHIHFMFRCQDATPLVSRGIFQLLNNTNGYVYLDLQNTGYLRLSNAGTGASIGTTTQLQDNTWYHIWVDRTMGSGTDGAYRAYISTSPIKPETPECSYDNGSDQHTINRVQLKATSYNMGEMRHINDYDQVYVDDVEITDVCE